MEHDQQVSKLPPLSSKYPWFIVQNLKDKHGIKTEFMSTLHDPLIKYECQIPEFYGRWIRGYFHGWFIISDHAHNVMWFLWNPVTSKILSLPPLSLKDGDGESINECLLTAPPDDPTSVLLLKRSDESTFVFCQINCKRIRMMKWTEISYTKQLKKITSDGELLHSLTCCNGKLYALNSDSVIGPVVIRVEIVAKNRRVKIHLLMFGDLPSFDSDRCLVRKAFIKGYDAELFCVSVGVDETTKEIGDVYLFRLDTSIIKWEELEGKLKKWDLTGTVVDKVEDDDLRYLQITRVMWEEMNELNDAMFYVDFGRDRSIFYNPLVASELGGYIQIRDKTDGILYLYHVEDRTIIASPMPSHVVSTTHVLMWEGRLEDDHVDVVSLVAEVVEVEQNGSWLHKIPFEVLDMIMKLCVGLEYLNFRATCKLCHLAAPVVRWSNESSLRKLHNYSLNSPWLMVVDTNRGIVTYTDPLSGDNYFMKKNSHISFVDDIIYCSRYGWLLCESTEFECPVFYNPFTNRLRKLPIFDGVIKSLWFSEPPTSVNCIVAGYAISDDAVTWIYISKRKRSWCVIEQIYASEFPMLSSTFIGGKLYGMYKYGDYTSNTNAYSISASSNCPIDKIVLIKAPKSSYESATQYFLMNCDEQLLLVMVSKLGEIEVFEWVDTTYHGWNKIESIGKHTIYICGTTSICVDAETPDMENKIYFPKQVWYSLDTQTYHTFDGEVVEKGFGGFMGIKTDFNCHAWIEPSWC